MSKTYSDFFAKKAEALKYDEVVYGPTSYSNLLWKIEKDQIRKIVAEIPESLDTRQHLDFACGTGRITSLFEGTSWKSSGIDISPAMLERARSVNSFADFYALDIINGEERNLREHRGRYDLITSFRFILNAEPKLRLSAFRALHSFLKPTGRLVFNNHGNLSGAKWLGLPRDIARRKNDGRPEAGYFLSHSKVLSLLKESGFVVEQQIGSGLLTSHGIGLLGFDRAFAWESSLKDSRLSRFGVNQIYVARKV